MSMIFQLTVMPRLFAHFAFDVWLRKRTYSRNETGEKKTNFWVRQQIGVSEEKGFLAQRKQRQLSKYGHQKRRSQSLVLTSIEVETKNKPGRRRTVWINNVRQWTTGGLRETGENLKNIRANAINCYCRTHPVLPRESMHLHTCVNIKL